MSEITMRDAFFDELYVAAKKDSNVILVSADMGAPSLDKYRRDLPEQFLNVGIAEANMITIATGLALTGRKVFVYAIMPFATSRCYEFIKVDLCLMNLPVTIIGVGAGVSYDESGPTHHSTEDITIMRALPNMTLVSPSDAQSAAASVPYLCSVAGPSYVRLDRKVMPVVHDDSFSVEQGCIRLENGADVCLVSTGNMLHVARDIAQQLKAENLRVSVVDIFRIKPLNEVLLLDYLNQCACVVTIEEHLLAGGLGSLVAEVMMDNNCLKPLKRIGIQDAYYYVYGGRKNLRCVMGLGTDAICDAVRKHARAAVSS